MMKRLLLIIVFGIVFVTSCGDDRDLVTPSLENKKTDIPSLNRCYRMLDEAFDTELGCLRAGNPCTQLGYGMGVEAGRCARKAVDSCPSRACRERLTTNWIDYISKKTSDMQAIIQREGL